MEEWCFSYVTGGRTQQNYIFILQCGYIPGVLASNIFYILKSFSI